MSEAAASAPAAPAAPSSTPSNGAPARAPVNGSATPPPAQAQATPSEHVEFDFGDGKGKQKLSPSEFAKHVSKLQPEFLKGRSATQLLTKAEQRSKEAAERESKYNSLEQAAEAGDLDTLVKQISGWKGMSQQKALALAEKMLMPHIEAQQLTPEQQRIRALEEQIQSHEREKQSVAQKEAERAHQEKLTQYQGAAERTAVAALQALGMPVESAPFILNRMYGLMNGAMDEEGNSAVPPEQLAAMVKDDLVKEHRSLAQNMSGAQLIDELLGDEIATRIAKEYVTRVRARRATNPAGTPAPQQGAQSSTPRPVPTKYLSPEEVRRQNRELQESL